jgi:transcriptional regulator with XRE-family HTH domain
VDPHTSLPQTLQRLDELIGERHLNRSDILDPHALAAKTALSESTVRHLLEGGAPLADTVNERVCSRMKALSDAYLTRTGKRMADLAAEVSDRLGISDVWARSVCDGKKMPNVELLHHLVRFFGVDGGESFFTAPADQALNRVLLTILDAHESASDHPVTAAPGYDDVRGIALRQAMDLSEDRWKVLNATLAALLETDDKEGHP